MNPARGENYKFYVFAALAIGLFASVADHGSVGVALPTIAEHFNTDLPTSQWVVIGYALTISAFLLPMGRLADIVGRKKIYLLGTVILITMGIAAGFAPNIGALIAAKLAQGIGSAMTQGTSMAMLIASFPSEERGKALGLQMSVVGTGNVAGPAVGGLLVGELGWEWVFFATSIMATVGFLSAYFLIDSRQADKGSAIGQKFDWPGAALSTATLLTFLQALTWASVLGFDNPAIILSFAIFAGLLAAFIIWELRTPNPMMDVRLFKRRLFSLGVAANYIGFVGMSSVRFLMPFYLQAVLGLTPSQVGLTVVPGAVCMIFMGPLSGRFSDKFGWRWFTIGGLLTAICGLSILATLRPDSHFAVAMAGMILQSAGMGTFYAPNNSSILSAVEPSKYGVISGFLNLVRNAGNLSGIAIATVMVTTTMAVLGHEPTLASVSSAGGDSLLSAFTSGLRVTYLGMAAIALVGVAASTFRGKPIHFPEAVEEPGQPARQGAD